VPPISHTQLKRAIAGPGVPLILIVDDSFDTRSLYGECLVDAGYSVACAADGNSALTLALSVVPDLVLLDLQMPGLDGWEAARLLRSYAPTRPIPIIAVSGHHDSPSVVRAMEAGCNRFIAKPCTPEELVRIIETTLQEDVEQRRARCPVPRRR
jgi:CheY-like chemotaxis protein